MTKTERYGGIAQLARALGSYPGCRWFESNCRYHGPLVKRLRHRPFTAESWVQFPYGSPFNVLGNSVISPFPNFSFIPKCFVNYSDIFSGQSFLYVSQLHYSQTHRPVGAFPFELDYHLKLHYKFK